MCVYLGRLGIAEGHGKCVCLCVHILKISKWKSCQKNTSRACWWQSRGQVDSSWVPLGGKGECGKVLPTCQHQLCPENTFQHTRMPGPNKQCLFHCVSWSESLCLLRNQNLHQGPASPVPGHCQLPLASVLGGVLPLHQQLRTQTSAANTCRPRTTQPLPTFRAGEYHQAGWDSKMKKGRKPGLRV